MELHARQRARLDRRHDRAAVLDNRGRDRVLRVHGVAVGEVEVRAGEPLEQRRRPARRKRVPAHVRDPRRLESPNRTSEQRQAGTALLARSEQELQADADSEDRPSGRDPFSENVGEGAEAGSGTRNVPDAGDHDERRGSHLRRIAGENRNGAGPGERGRDAAEVAAPVVRDHHLHASPFVERTPSPT